MNNKSNKFSFIEAFIVILLVILFVIVNLVIDNKQEEAIEVVSDNMYINYQISSADVEDNYLVLRGWLFELNDFANVKRETCINKEEISFVLCKLDSNGALSDKKRFFASPSWNDNEKVDNYFQCDADYSDSGFEVKYKLSKLNVNDSAYQVLIKTSNAREQAISTDYYIDKGCLVRSLKNSEVYKKLEQTDLCDIVNEGTVLVENFDNGYIVVQKDSRLYWVVDPNVIDLSGDNRVVFQTYTTNYNKLPKNRTDLGYYWDDIEVSFEKCEITNQMNSGEFRVLAQDIPSEYPIVLIETGICGSNGWVCSNKFRPVYFE